jgi:hypothetical protein
VQQVRTCAGVICAQYSVSAIRVCSCAGCDLISETTIGQYHDTMNIKLPGDCTRLADPDGTMLEVGELLEGHVLLH